MGKRISSLQLHTHLRKYLTGDGFDVFFSFFMESFLRDGHNSRAIHEELIGYLCKYLDLKYLVLIQF